MPRLDLETLGARARRAKLLLLDVDGVLTDGMVAISDGGFESKSFFIRDGEIEEEELTIT